MIKKIGNRISRIRKGKDLTQANMAEELGMTTSAYSKIERGDTNAPINRLVQIAKVLEVSIADFFDESDSSVGENSGKYGYATKDEVENLSRLVSILAKEIEKLREELPKTKNTDGKKKK